LLHLGKPYLQEEALQRAVFVTWNLLGRDILFDLIGD
jgi:hypothetical protein